MNKRRVITAVLMYGYYDVLSVAILYRLYDWPHSAGFVFHTPSVLCYAAVRTFRVGKHYCSLAGALPLQQVLVQKTHISVKNAEERHRSTICLQQLVNMCK